MPRTPALALLVAALTAASGLVVAATHDSTHTKASKVQAYPVWCIAITNPPHPLPPKTICLPDLFG